MGDRLGGRCALLDHKVYDVVLSTAASNLTGILRLESGTQEGALQTHRLRDIGLKSPSGRNH